MKRALCGGLAAALVLSFGIPAEAAGARSKSRIKSYAYAGNERGQIKRDPNSADYARARNSDPAGEYKAYPDWAAYALSPKGGDKWK